MALLDRIHEIDLRLVGNDLIISFRARDGFRPRTMNGQTARITLMTDHGPREISGKLKLRTRPFFASSSWHAYVFKPDRDYEMFLVLDWEDCRRTNVQRVSLLTDRAERHFTNPGFKAPVCQVQCAPPYQVFA